MVPSTYQVYTYLVQTSYNTRFIEVQRTKFRARVVGAVLTSPVAAARAAVATGARVKSKHDMYLIRLFTHPPEDYNL